MSRWTTADIADLSGKRILVTGVTSGLGTDIARALAGKGAEVVLAARSQDKLDRTATDLAAQVPGARLHRLLIDLADLSSVRRAALHAESLGPIDVLINNAGVMATPYHRTVDGFELQLATNHFGPFALTGLLLDQLVASGSGRVVSTSSQAHRLAFGAPLRDPRLQHGRYSKWRSYAQSKLADLQFTYALDRRLRAAGLPVISVAAHPGYSATGLMHARSMGNASPSPTTRFLERAFDVLGQPAAMGALPTLMAATADLPGGSYIGPDGLGQLRGYPRPVRGTRLARDERTQNQLWQLSEEATGVRYP